MKFFNIPKFQKRFFQEVLPEPQREFPPLTKTQISFSEKKIEKYFGKSLSPFSLHKYFFFELEVGLKYSGYS